MSPTQTHAAVPGQLAPRALETIASRTKYDLIISGWSMGFQVAGVVILLLIVFSNYRRGAILHKLIIFELLLALPHGFSDFFDDPYYGVWLELSTTFCIISYTVHNIVGWYKVRPFLKRRGSLIYLITLTVVQPYWVVDMYSHWYRIDTTGPDTYRWFHPWESLARDPWWVFCCFYLIYILKQRYNYGLWEIMRSDGRFSVLLFCMATSIILAIEYMINECTNAGGQNPYWRLALIFRCASDAIFLDNFQVLLNTLSQKSMGRFGGRIHVGNQGSSSDAKGLPDTGRRMSSFQKIEEPAAISKFGPTAHTRTVRSDSVATARGHQHSTGVLDKFTRLFSRSDSARASSDSQIHLETNVVVAVEAAGSEVEDQEASSRRAQPMEV